MSEPTDPTIGPWAVVTGALSQTLSDNGTRIAQNPSRLRNALTDVLADAGHAERSRVDVLVVAAGEGICAELLGRGRTGIGRSDQDLAALLVAQGFAPDVASMAVASWVAALGGAGGAMVTSLSGWQGPTADVTSVAPQPHVTPPAGLEGKATAPPPQPPPPVRPVWGGPPEGYEPPPVRGFDPEPVAAVPEQRRRPVVWLAAGTVVVVVAAGAVVALVLSGGKGKPAASVTSSPAAAVTSAAAASHSGSASSAPTTVPAALPSGLDSAGATAFVQADGRGSVTQNSVTTPIVAGAGLTLVPGESVSAAVGPVEISVGAQQAVRLRLGSGSRLTFVSAATTTAAAKFELATGNVYANVAAGAAVVVGSPAGQATLGPGRLFATCDRASCQFQALEEPQRVQTRAKQVVALTAHQVLTLPVAGTATAGVATSAPDAIRGNPAVAANLALDKQEHRVSLPITGASVLGDWSLTLAHVPAAVHRHVIVTVGCPQPGRCGLVVTQDTKYETCPAGAACRLVGRATTDDATGKRLSVAYPAYPVDCSGDGKADGTATAKDQLMFSSTGAKAAVTGTRTVSYAKGACQTPAFAATQTVALTGTTGKLPATAFPQPGVEESLVERYLTAGPCQRAARPRAGAVADVVCTYAARTDAKGETRPARVEYVLGSGATSIGTIYESVRSPTGLKNSGNCGGGSFPCEAANSGGGRVLVSAAGGSSGFLASYQATGFPMMVLATGASPRDMFTWSEFSSDFEYFKLRFVAI